MSSELVMQNPILREPKQNNIDSITMALRDILLLFISDPQERLNEEGHIFDKIKRFIKSVTVTPDSVKVKEGSVDLLAIQLGYVFTENTDDLLNQITQLIPFLFYLVQMRQTQDTLDDICITYADSEILPVIKEDKAKEIHDLLEHVKTFPVSSIVKNMRNIFNRGDIVSKQILEILNQFHHDPLYSM